MCIDQGQGVFVHFFFVPGLCVLFLNLRWQFDMMHEQGVTQHQRTQHQSVSHSHTVIYIYSVALCGNINTLDTLVTGTTGTTALA